MNIFGHDISFWLAVAGAALFKLATSPRMTWLRSLTSVLAALFAAWVFTKPVLAFLDLDGETYTIAVAVLAGLTGEGLMKWMTVAANDPKEAVELLKIWKFK